MPQTAEANPKRATISEARNRWCFIHACEDLRALPLSWDQIHTLQDINHAAMRRRFKEDA